MARWKGTEREREESKFTQLLGSKRTRRNSVPPSSLGGTRVAQQWLPAWSVAGSCGRDALTELLVAGRDRSHVGGALCPRCWNRCPWSRSLYLTRLFALAESPSFWATPARSAECDAPLFLDLSLSRSTRTAGFFHGGITNKHTNKQKEKTKKKKKEKITTLYSETQAVGKVKKEAVIGLKEWGEGELRSSPLHWFPTPFLFWFFWVALLRDWRRGWNPNWRNPDATRLISAPFPPPIPPPPPHPPPSQPPHPPSFPPFFPLFPPFCLSEDWTHTHRLF